MDNVEEMDKFLENYNFPKLDQAKVFPLQSQDFTFGFVLSQGKGESERKGNGSSQLTL